MLAVAVAAGSLIVDVHHGRSLNTPHNVLEEAVIKGVAAGAAFIKSVAVGAGDHQVGAMTTSPAHGSAFQFLIAAIYMGVAIFALFVAGLGCR
ncbi:unnamed protein product [Urochloa humidicola]